jgi:general secretion pathway protein C
VSATAWIDELRSGPGWTRLLEQRGAQMLCIALLLALGIDCAIILTRALSHLAEAAPSSRAASNAPARPAAVSPAVQLATIVNAHLFGSSASVSGGDNAPNTTMPLILAGVIADKDPNKGQAIIGGNAASAKLYAVGASIPGGARLHSIFADRVLIERNGALETLRLPRNAPSSGGKIASAVPTPRAESMAQNSTVLAGLVHIQPVFNQGKLSGYRIFPGGTRGNSAFTQLGLRAGDLILAVNGTALDDAGRAMEILQTLSSSASAALTVSRNGQSQEVNLNLANLSVDGESNPSDNAPANGAGAGAAAAPTGDGTAAPAGPPLRPRAGAAPQPAPPPMPAGSTANGLATGADAGSQQSDSAGANADRER